MAKQLSWYGRIKYIFAFCFLILFTFSFFSFIFPWFFVCLKRYFVFHLLYSNLLYNSFIFLHSSSFIILHNLHICVISVCRFMDTWKKRIQKKSSHLKDFLYEKEKYVKYRELGTTFFIHKCSVRHTAFNHTILLEYLLKKWKKNITI